MGSLLRDLNTGGGVLALAVSKDGSRLAAACVNVIEIWDPRSGLRVRDSLKGHTSVIWSLAFSPDERTIASCSVDKTIRLWDVETGNATCVPLEGHGGSVMSVQFYHDGRYLLSGAMDHTIRFWDVHMAQQVGKPINAGDPVWSVCISSADTKIACGCTNGVIKVYDAVRRTQLFECTAHAHIAGFVDFSPNDELLASCYNKGLVRIWDATSGRAIIDLQGHAGDVNTAVFSADGRYIATSSHDKNVVIWDLQSEGTPGHPLSGHTSPVRTVIFIPEGNHVISGSFDSTIKIWDIRHLPQPLQAFGASDSLKAQPIQDEITSNMTANQIVDHLALRGCPNLTSQLDTTGCSTYPISSGGFGDIFRCRLKGSHEVAIKTLRIFIDPGVQGEKYIKNAARELYIWSKCRHPNVQHLIGLVMFRDQIGMVTMWEAHGSLLQYLERYPHVNRCILSSQIAAGLAYLHTCGVIHGDLKSGNVLISQTGVPQLADFGNAALHDPTLYFTSTSTKQIMSLRWAAPELFEKTICSVHADIYALGMTILEAITGDIPWMGKTEHGVMFAVMVQKEYPERPELNIPPNSEHGDTLWELLKECWSFEPEKRPTAEVVKWTMEKITMQGLATR